MADEVTEEFIINAGLEPKTWKADKDVIGKFENPRFAFASTDSGEPGVEILAVSHPSGPTKAALNALWNARQGGQALPLLLVCLPDGGDTAILVGPATGDLEPREMPADLAARLIQAACDEPIRADQVRYLSQRVAGSGDQAFTGLFNNQLLADHTLAQRVRTRDDWQAATAEAEDLVGLTGRELVKALGFEIDDSVEAGTMSVLRTEEGGARALAVFLDQGESYETPSARFPEASPVSVAIARARRENLPFVVLTRGSEIRLHQAADRTGVGRKDAAEAYVEADVHLLADDERGFLPLVFSARALVEGGSFDEILEESRNYSADLSARLRERVYVDVVPRLAVAIANASDGVKEEDLDLLYEQAMLVLFRLLFVAYAEDRDLLPYRQNRAYHDNSLKSIALELVERDREGKPFTGDEATDLWTRVGSVWEAVDIGNPGWGVPAYNGGLFAADASAAAEQLSGLELTNEAFGPALTALLVEPGDPPGPVDFRTLSVRDFGTVYEGLLESSISIAADDLVVDNAGSYVPAGEEDEVVVAAGEIYHHNRSGARKSSGSYFTKEFAVEHLLDHALEPALDTHFERVQDLIAKGDTSAAKQALFDFRCADIAMGSGHFLVAATDRIELRMGEFLAEHELPELDQELAQLRAAAEANLGEAAEYYEIEDRMLLRRLIARRCVYGVDLNLIAVELARLALWVHTFVPGLPLSFLDHNLVCGNALTGVGTIEEAVDFLTEQGDEEGGQMSMFDEPIRAWIDEASEPLKRLARATDASAAELAEVKAAQEEAIERTQNVSDLFDLICAMRRGEAQDPFDSGLSEEEVSTHPGLPAARATGQALASLHFPVAFPEVFLRDRPGFDCLVGNPPWEEITVEQSKWWNLRFPGLRSEPQAEQRSLIEGYERDYPDLHQAFLADLEDAKCLRSALANGPYESAGGDPDLYKYFSWRFWQACREGGGLGIVLPQSAFLTKGASLWRRRALSKGSARITFCRNVDEWLFDDVNVGYIVSLVNLRNVKGDGDAGTLTIRSGVASLDDLLAEGTPVELDVELMRLNDPDLTIPSVGSEAGLSLFNHLLNFPPVGSDVREDFELFPARELDATNDATDFFTDEGSPVYNHRNVGSLSFDASAGAFAYANFDAVKQGLLDRRGRAYGRKASPVSRMPSAWAKDPETLPLLHPRIVFRDVVHSGNPRKVWACLAPANTVLTNAAPYLNFVRGGVQQQAFLLGILNSSVCDWFAHLRVGLHLNYFIFNALPVPDATRLDPALVARVVDVVSTASVNVEEPERYEGWASLSSGSFDVADAQTMIDGAAAIAYGLSENQMRVIWDGTNLTRPSVEAVVEERNQLLRELRK